MDLENYCIEKTCQLQQFISTFCYLEWWELPLYATYTLYFLSRITFLNFYTINWMDNVTVDKKGSIIILIFRKFT